MVYDRVMKTFLLASLLVVVGVRAHAAETKASAAAVREFKSVNIEVSGNKIWTPSVFIVKKGDKVKITLVNTAPSGVHAFSIEGYAGTAVQVVAKNVMLRSDTVSLGEGAMEPAILGRTFAAIFDAHVHPTAFGPSGPPLPMPLPLSSPMHPAISKSVMVKA